MANVLRNTVSDAEAIYFDELKQAATKLKVLKQRMTKTEREGRKTGNINWGHVGDIKHLNELLKEVLDFGFSNFQPCKESARKAVLPNLNK